jgi:threonine/homoserine/homoserine lactone efflux protein
MLFSYIFKAAGIGFSAAITPGPLQAVFLSYAIKGGWKRALPAAFAPLFSDGPVILIVMLVLTNIPSGFIRVLQIGGAVFLMYLAWESYKAFRKDNKIEITQVTNGWGTLLKATTMNLLAPGPWLFWSLINGPNLSEAWTNSPSWGALYLASFYGVFIIGNIILILLFSIMRTMGEKVRRGLLLISAVILAGFAVFQALQGLLII